MTPAEVLEAELRRNGMPGPGGLAGALANKLVEALRLAGYAVVELDRVAPSTADLRERWRMDRRTDLSAGDRVETTVFAPAPPLWRPAMVVAVDAKRGTFEAVDSSDEGRFEGRFVLEQAAYGRTWR